MSNPCNDTSGFALVKSALSNLKSNDKPDPTLYRNFINIADLPTLGSVIESLPPGTRSSYPHAHSLEDEFVYVLKGYGNLWVDGNLHSISAGDSIAFPAGTGVGHTIINDGGVEDLVLLVEGTRVKGDQVRYVTREGQDLKKVRFQQMGRWWADAPEREVGQHDGRPANPRSSPL